MENSNYTMDDIAKFIEDYNESNKYSSREWVINIPVVGRKLYEKAALENMKRTVFEKEYNKAKNGSVEEQNEFIRQMTPVLDDFYSSKEKSKIGRR